MANKYNNAADIMRVFLKATCKCRAQLALQQYRRKIILCQRYWKRYVGTNPMKAFIPVYDDYFATDYI